MKQGAVSTDRDYRVRLSAEGKRLLPNARNKLYGKIEGTYKGMTRSGFARVLFDGYRTETRLHPDFIERI